mgnify:CR=1 FL=1
MLLSVWHPPSWNSHVARHVTWPILSAWVFSSAVLCGQLFWTKAMFCKRLWVILWLSKCNIFKNAIFIGFFPIIAQSRDRKCKFLYTFREGSSRWTKWYITLVDTLPNKNVRGGRNPPPPLYVRVTKIDLYVRVLTGDGETRPYKHC